MNRAYDTKDCEAFSEALEKAWAVYLRTIGPTHDTDTAKAALTYAILNAAVGGERHPGILATAGVHGMENHQAGIRLQRSHVRPLVDSNAGTSVRLDV